MTIRKSAGPTPRSPDGLASPYLSEGAGARDTDNNVLLSLLQELENKSETSGVEGASIYDAEVYNRGIEVREWCQKVRELMK
jgi:hypothetical protein